MELQTLIDNVKAKFGELTSKEGGSENDKAKLRQYMLLAVVGGGFCVVTLIAVLATNHHKNPSVQRVPAPKFAKVINSGFEQDADGQALAEQQAALSKAQQKQGKLTDKIKSLLRQEEAAAEDQNTHGSDIARLTREVNSLKADLQARDKQNAASQSQKAQAMQSVQSVDSGHIMIDDFSASVSASDRLPAMNPMDYVPAGTFAKAIVLEGADTDAGANGQSNTSPMLFRIIGNGILPNHHHSHLKGCVVTAAAYGDISNERGIIRLQRLSCTYAGGQIVDVPVKGTVAGPGGKNGVRGIKVLRSDSMLKMAGLSGILSGIGGGLSQQYTTTSVSPLGNTTSVNPSQTFLYGGANGVNTAFSKLADYYMKLANQYHPIIQVNAGTVVDVVFEQGFYFGGKKPASQDDKDLQTQNQPHSQSQPMTSEADKQAFARIHHYEKLNFGQGVSK